MTGETTEPARDAAVAGAKRRLEALRREIGRVLIGQAALIDQILIALLADGHVLIEGVPGLGKTLLVRSLARCFGGGFARVQFTPDLMPSDVTGHAFFDADTQRFTVRRGPAFTNLLLADEVNRSPAKTQAALLEVMQERQITIEGESHPAPRPFMVLATQNPLEQEGTYPLPESELDRFLFKLLVDYPEAEAEEAMLRLVTEGRTGGDLPVESLEVVVTPEDVLELQAISAGLVVDREVYAYAVRLTAATRARDGLARGAGPRASIAMIRAGKAHALMAGRGFVTPDDVKRVAPAVLRHRVALSADLEIEGVSPDELIEALLDDVAAPRP